MKKKLLMILCALMSFMSVNPVFAMSEATETVSEIELKDSNNEKIARTESEWEDYLAEELLDISSTGSCKLVDSNDQLPEEVAKDISKHFSKEKNSSYNSKNLNNLFFGDLPSYTTTHIGAWHFATAVSGKGNHVFLEDGTGWLIASGDAYKTLDWTGSDIIMVITAPWYCSYTYILVNNSTGAHVSAEFTESPFEYNPYTLSIKKIDHHVGTITLSDKTVWVVPGSYDKKLMKGWMVNQKVSIGINGCDTWLNKWISKKAPNLLISIEPGIDGYVKARCEY